MGRKKILYTKALEDDLVTIKDFLDSQKAGAAVQDALQQVCAKIARLHQLEEREDEYRALLRKAWGLTPSSEKSKMDRKTGRGQGSDSSSEQQKKAQKPAKRRRKPLIEMGKAYAQRLAREKAEMRAKIEAENLAASRVEAGQDKDEQRNSPVSALGSSSVKAMDERKKTGLPVAKAEGSQLESFDGYYKRLDTLEGIDDDDDDSVDEVTRRFEESDDRHEQNFLQRKTDTVVRYACSYRHVKEDGVLSSTGTEDFSSVEEEVEGIFVRHQESAAEVRARDLAEGSAAKLAPIVPTQNLFEHDTTDMIEEVVSIPLTAEQHQANTRRSHEITSRMDVKISVKKLKCLKEIGFDAAGQRMIPPCEASLGPRGVRYTWNTLITLTTLVVKFVFPLSRVAKLLSSVSKQFSRSTIWNMLAYAGETLLPAYLGLIEECAFHATQFHADDSDAVTRTTRREAADKDQNIEDTRKSAEARNLGKESMARVRKLLPYRNKKVDGTTDKEKLHLSVVIGRTSPEGEDNWFFVYYSHIGSVGDVLSRYFQLRKERMDSLQQILNNRESSSLDQQCAAYELKKIPTSITIIRDQSSQNTARIPEDYGFTIKTCGCLMHARRKFRHNSDEDIISTPALICELLISDIFRVESWCTLAGRTAERVRRLRERYTRPLLDGVEAVCESMCVKEPVERFRKAAEYFMKNKSDFYAHIDDPYVAPDSGLPERAIRTKKLFARSSFGHETKRGTLCYDIIRSIMATCIACRVSYSDYFKWVALQREELGDERFAQLEPRSLTPQAFLRTQKENKKTR